MTLLVGLITSHRGHCQNATHSDFQAWTDITLIHHFSQKWSYNGDMGLRGIISDRNWNLIYLRPTIRWRITPSFDMRSGISLFQTWNKDYADQTELRFHQEANLNWPYLAGFIFKHMIRFEERFFFNQGIENDFSARFRYRPWMETPDFKLFGIKSPFYCIASIDLFFPLGESATELFVNNYRLIAGLGNRISEKLKIELHYFWQRSKAFTDEGFQTSENVLRLRFFLHLNEQK